MCVFLCIVPKVLAIVYATCSSYPEENADVVRRALQQAQARADQEGEPKQAKFRSASLSAPQCAFCFCLHHCLSLSVCIAVCLSVCQLCKLFVCLPLDRLLSKPQHTSDRNRRKFGENIIKGAISCL